MQQRPVSLIVDQGLACPLIRKGDHYFLIGRELSRPPGVKLCAGAICSLFPKIEGILSQLPPGANLPDDVLFCETEGCDAIFRMEFTPSQESPVAQGTTRRLERTSTGATALIKPEPFLKRLTPELATELVSICTTTELEPNEVVLCQGMVGRHLYIVADGFVEVVRRPNETDETVLVTLGAGECFGEMSILTGEVTSAEVRSKGKAVILSLHRDKLEALLVARPLLSRAFSKLLAERLKATNVSLESELSRGILGKLSMIALPDLVQTLYQSRRTGILVVSYAGATARMGFRNGALRTAILGDLLGEEAFYKVLIWPDGEFCFEQAEPSSDDPGEVTTDTMMLMMEGMRRLDERRAETTEKPQ